MTVKPSIVFVEKVTNLDLALKRMLYNLNFSKSYEKIAIKLNLCDYRLPETGAVSDPKVVAALLKALRSINQHARILIFENDATNANADLMFRYLGIDKISKVYSAEVINIAHEKWTKKQIDGYRMKTVKVPVILEDCDLLITHPKLKTHSLTKLSCGLKNMFGCYRTKKKVKFHKFLDEAIVDINLALRPDASIVDANICHEGIGGPSYGFPKKVGLIIGGKDIVAVDTFCANLMGFRPWFVGHIRKAASKGLGQLKYRLEGNLEESDLKMYRFKFNRALYYLMKIFRDVYVSEL